MSVENTQSLFEQLERQEFGTRGRQITECLMREMGWERAVETLQLVLDDSSSAQTDKSMTTLLVFLLAFNANYTLPIREQ